MSRKFFVDRTLQTIPVVLGITLVVFSLMHLTPGDPVETMLGSVGHISQEDIELIRHELGLDQPLWKQYLGFLGGIFRGDWGVSLRYGVPVKELILERLPATLELTLAAMAVSLMIAIPAGVLAAVRRYSIVDQASTLVSLIGVSMPDFWLGLVLILIFSVGLGWLPGGLRLGFEVTAPPTVTGLLLVDSLLARNWEALWAAMKHLLLPALALGAPLAALTMRITRSSMLDVIQQDYITFARAKGLKEAVVIIKHALRNALIPTITVIALNMGTLLGGNMIIERIFSWPGLGQLVVDSIRTYDYPVVQASVMLYALTYVAMNLAADLVYTRLDPRVKL
ncbi:MAG: ABC transporter permease [Limnochordia bacterium]|jgi:ABC-type dipeptide/oligopeptide/nickel transport system permease component|nr:ABC transporter permease [Bacillota bacterium]